MSKDRVVGYIQLFALGVFLLLTVMIVTECVATVNTWNTDEVIEPRTKW